MTTIYSQLRVSCGLSATINALQPETFKATMTQSFSKWLEIQWLKLTNNEDPQDPLVQLAAGRKEYKWVLVLDYILLRKIQSSFLLCEGVPPGSLVLEVEFEDLSWNVLKPAFITILTRLNNRKQDWPLWRYNGELKNPEENLDDEDYQRKAVKMVQSIKVFWEIFSSNITMGAEGDWKNIFMNLVGFPQELTHGHVVEHIDHYKTDFELAGLLQTFGYELDTTYGRGYPKSTRPNSIVLINRPEHWVCEDSRSRGVVLDSLTQATDSIHPGDSFNYFKPEKNLREFRKSLKNLESLFPDIEVSVEEEDLVEFPELELPETHNPAATAQQYHHSAHAAYVQQDFKKALLDKRIECALLEQVGKNKNYFDNLLKFTEWCIERDKPQTAQEKLLELQELQDKIETLSKEMKARRWKMEARFYSLQHNKKNAINSLQQAFNLYKDTDHYEESYEMANSLGTAYAKADDNEKAIELFENAFHLAQKAKESQNGRNIDGPKKYWPAIEKALQNKVKYLKENIPVQENPEAVEKVE